MKLLKLAAILAVSALTMLASATTATGDPAPGYEKFGDCPDRADDPDLIACAVTDVYDGHLQIGTKDTPISDPIKLTLGFGTFANGVGATLHGGMQRIPGGLIGITGLDWLRFIYPLNLLQIYAEPELAGPVTSPFPPIDLPLKVQLHNALLNNNCYIGANNDPIALNLTTGTTSPPPPNQPITGSNGTPGSDPNAIQINGARLVDNAFAAPVARNCDLLSLNLLVTTLVNAQSGLPAAAGTNEAVQDVNIEARAIEAIYPPNGIE